jgi:hypothetical protein
VTDWPTELGEWAEHRNAASQTGTVTKAKALSLRSRLLGVGCEDVLGRVVGVGAQAVTWVGKCTEDAHQTETPSVAGWVDSGEQFQYSTGERKHERG